MTLSRSGLISGTPKRAGTYTIVVKCLDSSHSHKTQGITDADTHHQSVGSYPHARMWASRWQLRDRPALALDNAPTAGDAGARQRFDVIDLTGASK